MEYPAPDDAKRSPVWENYVVAQAAQAALGLIPPYAHAIGVRVDGYEVTLVVQAPDGFAAESDEDVVDIGDELETLLGPEAHVATEIMRSTVRRIGPHDGVRWLYAARI